jgi:hypothetical protein
MSIKHKIMKAMNYFFAVLFVLVMGACSNEDQSVDEELILTKGRAQESEVQQEVFELDLHQYSLLKELEGLYAQKIELESEIEDGDKDQIPLWESTVKLISKHSDALLSVLTNSCSYLRMRERILQIQLLSGDEQTKAELQEVREKLKKCPIELDSELNLALETQTIILAIKGGGIGGRCDPGEDWTCLNEFERGILLLNIVETQPGRTEVFLKNSYGEIIGQGEIIGEHRTLEGVTQVAIELQAIEKGVIQVVSESGSYEHVITVH